MKEKPSHELPPNEVLGLCMISWGVSTAEVASYLQLSVPAMRDVLEGRFEFTPILAQKLSKYFHTDAEFWLRWER